MGVYAGSLWQTLMPIQGCGIVIALAHAVLAGFQEKARGAGLNGELVRAQMEGVTEGYEKSADNNELARPKLFVFNVILTIAVIGMLVWDVFPGYVPFMLGVCVALFANYGFASKTHRKIISLHAGPAMMMCSTLMGAAVLMGVLTSSLDPGGNVISTKVMELDPGSVPSVV